MFKFKYNITMIIYLLYFTENQTKMYFIYFIFTLNSKIQKDRDMVK